MKTNRRQFIALTSTGAAGLAAGCSTPSKTNGDWIDAHVHVWTPDVARYPLAEGFTPDRMVPASFTPEELFALSRPEGVRRIVLIQMSFYKFDNSYMLAMMRQYPGVFGGVAIVDESRADVTTHMKQLAGQGVRGFRLYASREKAAQWTGSAGMNAMWREGAESGLAMCCLADPAALPDIRRMCERYPETPVVIDHFARIGLKGAVDESQLEDLIALARFKNTHVKTSAFYALGKKKPPYTDLGPMIRKLRDAFGAERLMWATDCPYQSEDGHSYADSIALIRDRLDFLSDSDKRWILRGTAEKVFFRS